MWSSGDLTGAAERMEEAFAALADEEPGAELAELAEALARVRYFLGDTEAATERVERALEIAEALVLPRTLVHALNTRHLVLETAGRYEESLALLEYAITLGRRHDLGEPLDRALHNLSYELAARDRLLEADERDVEVIERARRRGDRVNEQRALGHRVYNLWALGDWDEVDAIRAEITLPDTHAAMGRLFAAVWLSLPRGDVAAARAALEQEGELRHVDEAQQLVGFHATEAQVLRAEQRLLEALAVAREALDMGLPAIHPFWKFVWIEAWEAALDLGDEAQVEELLGEVERLRPSDRTPLLVAQEARFRGRLAAQRGEREQAVELLAQAVEGFRALQTPFWLAIVLVELAELGGGDSARLLAEARAIFERLGARPWLERIDALERSVAV
jgi:tetratricopeptide (TPR) repeat protein